MSLSPSPHRLVLVATLFMLAACGETARLTIADGTGPRPQLPPPQKTLIPTVNIAPAQGWQPGQAPTAAAGLSVSAFAQGLDHPRWVTVLPNGDVLVAESNKPAKPDAGWSLRGWVMKMVMKRAGAGVPSADRITLLRDADGDGKAETRSVFLEKLHSPFGMALVGNDFYVADTDAIRRFPYTRGMTRIEGAGSVVFKLPAGPRNHHWTKNVIASLDGTRLYATVGSNSNVAEHGMAEEEGRAAIWEIDPKTGQGKLFASGLRNPNGMAWVRDGGAAPVLWTVVNERDELGSDLVPDYLTSVRENAFYGWPYSYFGPRVDERVKPARPDLVARAVVPDYALGPHTAALGLAWAAGTSLPAPFAHGMFIGLHGSWNRRPASGYKVIFVPFKGAQPEGAPVDVLTGFLDADGNARGRPVGVALDGRGALLVADDVGNTIWRVQSQSASQVKTPGQAGSPASAPPGPLERASPPRPGG